MYCKTAKACNLKKRGFSVSPQCCCAGLCICVCARVAAMLPMSPVVVAALSRPLLPPNLTHTPACFLLACLLSQPPALPSPPDLMHAVLSKWTPRLSVCLSVRLGHTAANPTLCLRVEVKLCGVTTPPQPLPLPLPTAPPSFL